MEAKYLHAELTNKYFEERKEKHIAKILGIKSGIHPEVQIKGILLTEAINKASAIKIPGPDNIENYNRFLLWMTKNHPEIKTIEQIDNTIALQYMTDKYKKFTAKSFNTVKSSLSAVWKILKFYKIINVWDSLSNKTIDSEHYRNLSNEEVKAILDNTSGFWYYATLISFYTGLRKKDIFFLTWDEVKEDHIDLIPDKTKKNKKHVFIPLHPELSAALKKLTRKSGECLFPEAKYNSGTFQKQFTELLKKLEIKNASFHSLRATFITNCEEAGIPRKVIQGIVGHGSPLMTEKYSHDKESAKIIKSLPSIKIIESE